MNPKQLKEVLNSPLGSVLKDLPVRSEGVLLLAKDSGGLWHFLRSVPYARCTEDPLEAETVTLEKLAADKWCTKCFNYSYTHPLNHLKEAKRVFDWYQSYSKVRNAGKVSAKTSAGALQNRIQEVSRIHEAAKQRLNESLTAEFTAAYQQLSKAADEVLSMLRKLATGDDTKAKLEKKVQELLVPPKWRNQQFELNSEMMLIGINPLPHEYDRGTQANTVKAVIDAYAIRKDKVAVLYAPAYFYSFLVGHLFLKKNGRHLVVSSRDPGSAEARENAAALWSPENESTLACLSRATDTGEALSD